MKTRAERRRLRSIKIKQRKSLAKSVLGSINDHILPEEDGKFSNNNEMNRVMTGGCSKKTKTKNSHSNYRRSGCFGTKAINYRSNEQRQVDEYKDQLKEYNEEIK